LPRKYRLPALLDDRPMFPGLDVTDSGPELWWVHRERVLGGKSCPPDVDPRNQVPPTIEEIRRKPPTGRDGRHLFFSKSRPPRKEMGQSLPGRKVKGQSVSGGWGPPASLWALGRAHSPSTKRPEQRAFLSRARRTLLENEMARRTAELAGGPTANCNYSLMPRRVAIVRGRHGPEPSCAAITACRAHPRMDSRKLMLGRPFFVLQCPGSVELEGPSPKNSCAGSFSREERNSAPPAKRVSIPMPPLVLHPFAAGAGKPCPVS